LRLCEGRPLFESREFFLQNLSGEGWVGFAFGEFHDLAFEEVESGDFACLEIGHGAWIGGDGLIDEDLNRAGVAFQLEAFFLDDGSGGFSRAEHLGEDFFALFGIDGAGVDEVHEFIEGMRCNGTLGYANGG